MYSGSCVGDGTHFCHACLSSSVALWALLPRGRRGDSLWRAGILQGWPKRRENRDAGGNSKSVLDREAQLELPCERCLRRVRRSDGMVDVPDSKSGVLHGRAGSSPAFGTLFLLALPWFSPFSISRIFKYRTFVVVHPCLIRRGFLSSMPSPRPSPKPFRPQRVFKSRSAPHGCSKAVPPPPQPAPNFGGGSSEAVSCATHPLGVFCHGSNASLQTLYTTSMYWRRKSPIKPLNGIALAIPYTGAIPPFS